MPESNAVQPVQTIMQLQIEVIFRLNNNFHIRIRSYNFSNHRRPHEIHQNYNLFCHFLVFTFPHNICKVAEHSVFSVHICYRALQLILRTAPFTNKTSLSQMHEPPFILNTRKIQIQTFT